ncbi:MAG TPA: alginate lyase family protein [Gemmatimonadaceae bacterium]|nr:alginate lyase family protein [Gemmatimonadaceae bacterium]
MARDPKIFPAYLKLLADANRALRAPLISVTHKKTLLPPTGDAHDYYSLSPYWWPDPSKKDGLPYIRRDGETNPESKRDLDQPRVAALGANLQTLALAWYFTRDEKYAARAAEQLRYWFLDPATRMNPHLRFAQLVRGNPRERGSGIIDTRWFIEAVQAASLIEGSRSWGVADRDALKGWFQNYLNWLQTSPNGAHERAAKNNHGSWFAAQTATYALFIGDTATALRIVEAARVRIDSQVTARGEQPIEMERTRSMHYAGFNIEALSRLSEIGHAVGVDLWNYQAPGGGSLRRAIDHVARYLGTGDKWPGRQIDDIDLSLMVIHVRRALNSYGDPSYRSVLARLPRDVVLTDRSGLLYPDLQVR